MLKISIAFSNVFPLLSRLFIKRELDNNIMQFFNFLIRKACQVVHCSRTFYP